MSNKRWFILLLLIVLSTIFPTNSLAFTLTDSSTKPTMTGIITAYTYDSLLAQLQSSPEGGTIRWT